ncbi:MAG: Asp-tRNA(Asn)/Glu-tRNA(Gln) amidotransferase subunit GatC [archaeon]|jgi:aspartyl-tRNA(Asn)/glutamyl-tRNA(Gln) amidotransferase subunit C
MEKAEVTKELIWRVAANARLNLNEKELEKFAPQIKEIILDSFNKLDEIEAEEEPSFQPTEMKNVFRKDEPKKCLTQEEALSNAKKELKEKGYFKGPKVL